ncbi:MAG: thiol-disulfide oxidoreductase DCC family protein [Ginsengibacter sp.]
MTNNYIILFDGVCNLCNGAVNFIIQKDKKQVYSFASLQSDFGKDLLRQFNLESNNMNSLVLIENDKAYLKSSAALHIAKNLRGIYSMLYGFMIVPKFIRDFVYSIIAKNRYKWFGKTNECMIPTAQLRARFLE